MSSFGVVPTPEDKIAFMIHKDEHLLESFVTVVSMALANFYEMML